MCSLREHVGRILTAALAILLISITSNVATSQESSDTTAVEAPVPPATPTEKHDDERGRVRISIDESGISIEGNAKISTDDDEDAEVREWVEIRDERGPHREKGFDIVKLGESVFVDSDELVRGNITVFGGDVIVEGRVFGHIVVIGGTIRARSGAEIQGDVIVIGGSLDEDDDVLIVGEREVVGGFPTFGAEWLGYEGPKIKFVLLPLTIFIQLICAFLVMMFLRDRVMNGENHLRSGFLKSFGAGLLASFIGFFALLILMIPLIITVIGIPLALLLIVSCVGVMFISWTIFAYTLGRVVSEKFQFRAEGPFLALFIGAIVLNLPSIIGYGMGATGLGALQPLSWTFNVVGGFFCVIAHLSGFGALVLSRFGSRPATSEPPVAATSTPPTPAT